MDKRTALIVGISCTVAIAVVLSSTLVALVISERAGRVEILVHDVALVADRPSPGQTELHLFLVLVNTQKSAIAIDRIVLWAWDPRNGTLFDTYVHGDVSLAGRASTSFSEVSTLGGIWSEVAFKVVVFGPRGRWESALTPDRPVVYVQG